MQKAFTLIELMIAIAIIGLLAGLIVTLYPRTLTKFHDARMMSALSQIRAEAAIIFYNTKNYIGADCLVSDGVCTCSEIEIQMLCQDAQDHSIQDVVFNMNDNGLGFCAFGYLEDAETYFCVDGGLRAKTYSDSPGGLGGSCHSDCKDDDSCACE